MVIQAAVNGSGCWRGQIGGGGWASTRDGVSDCLMVSKVQGDPRGGGEALISMAGRDSSSLEGSLER